MSTFDRRCEDRWKWKSPLFDYGRWTHPEVEKKRSVSRWPCKKKRSTNSLCNLPDVLGIGGIKVISDAAQDRTCTARAVVRSGHRTTAQCGQKKLKFFFCPFSSPSDPFPRVYLPRTKTIFFSVKKKISGAKIEWLTIWWTQECLHQEHRRPADLWHPCQRTTMQQYQKWRPTISWEVRSRTTVVRRRVTKELSWFEDWVTFGDPVAVELTWGWWGVRNRSSCANHI